MRIVRFEIGGEVYRGELQGKAQVRAGSREFDLSRVRLLAPAEPTKVVAVGLNYRDHAQELGQTLPEEPLLFLKPSTTVIGPGEPVRMPLQSSRVDYEAELGIVIGKITKGVNAAEARDHILGFTCLNDVTARDLQVKDGQWTRAKGFDTFCPIGPWIETDLDPADLSVELFLNGELKQKSRTSNLIFDPLRLVEFISSVMTLCPGDIIATGTPSGIGPMKEGDVVEVTIEGIGTLSNPVERGY
jgi:2-keto-4-pentenoate hydratase/2-oxohepta-3-ene-1,7-dioic acid hydratase in catechol pathway